MVAVRLGNTVSRQRRLSSTDTRFTGGERDLHYESVSHGITLLLLVETASAARVPRLLFGQDPTVRASDGWHLAGPSSSPPATLRCRKSGTGSSLAEGLVPLLKRKTVHGHKPVFCRVGATNGQYSPAPDAGTGTAASGGSLESGPSREFVGQRDGSGRSDPR